jgi:DNA-binding transcriptional MerR regulator
MSRKSFYRSGELARLFDISSDTLRHYERMGLIPALQRSDNGYREYPLEVVDRIQLVRSALSVGFSIRELSRILKSRDQGRPPCREVRDLAREKLNTIEERLRELKKMRIDLQGILNDWDERLKKAPRDQPARLLDALARSRVSNKIKGE